ncbi:MAG TPA: SDR family NAD(P)-dependent oxidoreductase [Patescibacteria group bacterium]|nr:SDR family NAD(P)-dependent oxidoreductase [Patescibacteria group bacterium]
MKNFTKPFAVVTGASSGIGLELARQFVQNGFHVLGAAEDAGIYNLASQLSNTADVEAIQVDLRKTEGIHELVARIQAAGAPVEAIAINAGVGLGGAFVETDLQKELDMIALNVTSSVHLAKHIARDMAARGKGRILFTSSVAAVMPAPFEAVYGATKAFLLSFSDALRNELKDSGVTVTALMPGQTETNFFRRAEMMDTKVGTEEKDDPADVARRGYEALMNGEAHIVGGSFKTWAMGHLSELLPESVKAEMHRHLSEPGSANK